VAALALSRDGRRVTANALDSYDPDGFVLNGSISFGDGSAAQPGLQSTHEYANGGTFGVTVTVTDADGVSRSATQAVVVPDPGAPPAASVPKPPPAGVVTLPPAFDAIARLVLDRVGLSRPRFAVIPQGGTPGGNRGAQLSLRLSAPASVTVQVERARKGRRVRGRCVSGARRGAPCTLYSSAGTINRSFPAGTSQLLMTGRFGSKSLPAGAYRLTVTAHSADGQTAGPRTAGFSIIRARRKK
jgi:hypothetical protein